MTMVIAAAVGLLGLLGVTGWWVIDTLATQGTWDMPVIAWVCAIVGVVVGIGLGVGLMRLMYYSDRSGHDAGAGRSVHGADEDHPAL